MAAQITIQGPNRSVSVVSESHRTVEVTTGETGPPGPPGAAYTHYQTVAASVWTINHSLGYNPNLTVIDSGGSEVEGDIVFLDANTVQLTFSAAFSGSAYLS